MRHDCYFGYPQRFLQDQIIKIQYMCVNVCMLIVCIQVCSVDEIYHILSQNNMNNQNSETQNQNWRPHAYIQEPRSHAPSRSGNYYGHYPSPHFINDYLNSGYVYPGVIPSYRSGQAPMSSSNSQMVNPLAVLSPQDYAKYYNKMENYIPPDPRLSMKNYSPHPSYYEHAHQYRTHHYHGLGVQNQGHLHPSQINVYAHHLYPPNLMSKFDKTNKNKSIIVIESDEENIGSYCETQKIPLQKKEEKLPVKESENEEKRQTDNIEIQEQKKQTIVRVLPPLHDNSTFKEANKAFSVDEERRQEFLNGNFQNPSKKVDKQIIMNSQAKQIVPLQIIEKLRDEILSQLQTVELPDMTMKMFLTFKTLQAYSKYEENAQSSMKVFNFLQIYRAIIEFQKQRKYFIQNIFGDQILKRFNYVSKNKGQSPSFFESRQKINRLAQQINENNVYMKKQKDKKNLKQDENKKNFNGNQDFTSNKQKQQSNLLYPPKTKKISKKQLSDQYSQEISLHTKNKIITQKDPSQLNPNVICQRKLRDRKKKKNKKEKYEKSYSEKYLKDAEKQDKIKLQKVESSKVQKISSVKQNKKPEVQLSPDEEGLIQKIQGWAERAAIAYSIEEKHKKAVKTSISQQSNKQDSFKIIKKDDSSTVVKKYKERSTKASQSQFKAMLLQKIEQQKTDSQSKITNLMTFVTGGNLTDEQKEDFQKQLAHLTKQLKNNQNHGRIRIGKQYYQAKMPNFIKTQTELSLLIKQKKAKLMERKMSVFTF